MAKSHTQRTFIVIALTLLQKIKYMKYLLLIMVLAINTFAIAQKKTKVNTLQLFEKIIVGNFTNEAQVAAELAAGQLIHPRAKHINRVADSKIIGLPQTNIRTSFWVLEESYYEYPNKPVEVKPYLFNFAEGENNTIVLKVYQLPTTIDKKDIRNDNSNLQFNYAALKPSPTFSGATYTYNKKTRSFTTSSTHELGNGLTFTLTETLNTTQLIVMELLTKAGKQLTPYSTPIIYDRQ